MKLPSPDHPITIVPTGARVVVTADGVTTADTRQALALSEASYRVVQYVPREDVDMSQLEASTHETYCPFKGDATYFSIPALGERGANAVWTYEAAYDAVAEIKSHLAFYPDRVEITVTPD